VGGEGPELSSKREKGVEWRASATIKEAKVVAWVQKSNAYNNEKTNCRRLDHNGGRPGDGGWSLGGRGRAGEKINPREMGGGVT